MFPGLAWSANISSAGSGAWNSPATWGGTLPGVNDHVFIMAGHTVSIPDIQPATTVLRLTVNTNGKLFLGKTDFTVTQETVIFGRIEDAVREGINTFRGPATFQTGSKGRFELSFGTGGIVRFENGLTNHGDSLVFRRVEFLTNNQTIGGSRVIELVEKLEIGAGITLTNANTAGIRLSNANVNGLGAGAVFRNETKLDVLYQFELMTTGSVDFSHAGNVVIYRMASDQQITPGTYSRLHIQKDGVSLFRKRFLVGDVTVGEYFFVEDTSTFEPKEFNFTVTGLAQIEGRFSDKFTAGTNTFQDVVLRGLIEGSGQAWGKYLINGNLTVDGLKADIRHANMQIFGVTTIPGGSTLAINNNEGPRIFGDLVIDAGGTFNSSADLGVELSGLVTNNGSFYWKYGVLFGHLQHEGDTAWINKLQISGTNAEISGSQRVWIKDQVNFDSAAVFTNSSTGGLFFYDRGKANGAHASSTFINKGVFHNQTDNIQMETGEFDGNYPGSVVYFDRQLNLGQRLSPGSYYDVYVLGGLPGAIRKIGFATDTMKVYHRFEIGADTKFEPAKASLLCYGHAVLRGEIFDGDGTGTFQFNTVDVSGAKFTGGNNAFGQYNISGELQVSSGSVEIHHANMWVSGKTLISPGHTLTVITRSGTKDLGRTEVAAGAYLFDNTGGDTLYFSGKLVNYGRVKLDYPVFRGGIDNNSDTITLFAPIFQGNPSLTGSSPLVLRNRNFIDRNTRLTSYLDSLVFVEKSTFVGLDSSSVFVNRGTMYWENNAPFLTVGTLDCSVSPNTIVYRYQKGDIDLRAGTYWHLRLPTDPTRNLPKRRIPEAGIQTLGNFILDWNVELQPRKANIEVGETAFLYGKVYDDEVEGLFRAKNMLLGNALVGGQSTARFGAFEVTENLTVNFGTANWENAHLDVLGTLVVSDSAILNLNTNAGRRNFNNIVVGAGSLLNENGNGQTVNITGKVEVDGTFSLSNGTFTFEKPIVIYPEGAFVSTKTGSSYSFLDSLQVEGLMQIPQGEAIVKGPLIGEGKLLMEATILMEAGDTLVNTMTGQDAFMMRAGFVAEDNSSHLINRGILRYGPRSNEKLMANGGTYDFLSHPTNWLIFDGTSGFQPVPAETFLNVGFENGGSKAIAGDSLKILGDFYTRVEVRKDPSVFSTGILMFVGDNDQKVDGFSIGVVENMVVRKTGGSIQLMTDMGIKEGLVLQQGVLQASPGTIALGGSAFIQEGDFSYVLGRVGTERNISQGQTQGFGGMGISVQPKNANMGPTLVYRNTGQAMVPGQIERYYEIFPTNNTGLNATVEVGYHERDLRGAIESDLQVTHRAEPESDFEVLGGGTYRVSNFVRKTAIDRLGVLSLVPSTMAVNAFPSPFTDDRFTVSFTLSEDDPFVDLRIFDMAGREWVHKTVEGVAGTNTLLFDELQLPAGTYLLRVVSRELRGYHHVQKLTP